MKGFKALILSLLLPFSSVLPGVIEERSLERNLEYVKLTGGHLPEFANVPVESIFVCVYKKGQGWSQIPFQLDEVGPDGDLFTSDDELLDDNDEILFLVKDMGDRVSLNTWIEDEDSRAYPRYEITVIDPLDPAKKAWAYIYRSSTLTDTVTTDYISYNPSADMIITPYYELDHDENAVPVELVIPTSGGGNGQDILDRQKTRVKGHYYIDYTVNEQDNLQRTDIRHIDGRIRVIRRVWFDFRIRICFIGCFWITVTSFDLTTRYYPFCTVAGGGMGTLKSEWGISLIRQSSDFNANAEGMVWYNPSNPRTTIDGDPDAVDPTLTLLGLNWVLITGEPGSVVIIVDMPHMPNTTQRLYYWDRAAGGTGDGTPDTGDRRSYGDIGIIITGNNISGTFSFKSTTFYLPANQDSLMGATLASYVANPLQIGTKTGRYDGIPPAPIVFETFDVGDTSITLTWRAPYDDGTTGGRVASYDLRYSPSPIGPDTLAWWETAIQVPDEPVPSDPGTIESYTVRGLSKNTTYYFGIVAEDDAGNRSPLIYIFTATTVPIELLSLTASVEGNTVILHWSTLTETNNFGFEIERQGEEPSWRKVGFVPGAGTTTEPHDYTFLDHDVPPGRYLYRLNQIDTNGSFSYSEPIAITVNAPGTFTLGQNYPNPFNLKTRIPYQVPRRSRVVIKIYNIVGQVIKTLVDDQKGAGYFTAPWDGRDEKGREVTSGVYFYQMKAGDFCHMRKMILLQ